jgi:hypothetical protein
MEVVKMGEELKLITKVYMELCIKLHKNMDLIPKKVQDDIWDNVYEYYNPNE